MKKKLFALFLFALSSQAFSETCKSGPYVFEISKETIILKTVKTNDSLSLNIVLEKIVKPGSELQTLVAEMLNSTDSGKPITEAEAKLIKKISLVATENTIDADVFTYAKAFDTSENLIARYVMFQYGNFRCR
jgi:hypothetical protein